MGDKSEARVSSSGRKRRRVGLVYDERMCKHKTPNRETHPENPDRIRAVWNKLLSADIPHRCVVFDGKEVEDKYIAAVHSNAHINLIKNISSKKPASKRNKVAAKYDSIYFNEGSSESASLAAGSVLQAAEKVAKGELNSAFAIVRPPGHHAEKCEPMGFCLYNNVAIATSFLLNQKELGINKILIVDWDVHHGNGTQKMFYKDPRVLVFSVHRHENGTFYPPGDDGSHIMMGEGPGAGYNINVPWENDQCGDADYIAVWDHILIPVAREFKPDMIMISAGFDAAIGDPIGCCCVTPDGYSIMLRKLMKFSKGKTIMALEGGYYLDSLANSVLACVEVLLEGKSMSEVLDVFPLKSTWRVIKEVREQLSEYWPILSERLPRKLTSRVTPQVEVLQEDVIKPHSELDDSKVARDQIKEFKKQLAQQLTANANLASDILAKDKTIADKDKTIADMDKTLADKDKTIADKDKTIADMDKTLADRDKTIREKDKTIATKDKTITDMDKILADKDKTIVAKDKTIAAKDKTKADINKTLADKDKRLANKDKELETLKQQLAILRANIIDIEEDSQEEEVKEVDRVSDFAEDPKLSERNQGTSENEPEMNRPNSFLRRLNLEHLVDPSRALELCNMSNKELLESCDESMMDLFVFVKEAKSQLCLLNHEVNVYRGRILNLEAKSVKDDATIKKQVLEIKEGNKRLQKAVKAEKEFYLEIEVLKKQLKDSLDREKAMEEERNKMIYVINTLREQNAKELKDLEDRCRLATKCIPDIIYTFLVSAEFYIALAKVIDQAVLLGRQLSLENIHTKMLPYVAIETMDGYDGTVHDRFYKAVKEFEKTKYPYLKEIESNGDKPLDVIMKIKPKTKQELGWGA